MDTWKTINPSWKVVLWNDDLIEDLNIENMSQLSRCKNFSEKSDILRYELLYQFGGLYVDTDVECLKSIDSLFDRDFVIFLESKNRIGTAFVAATKNHTIIRKIVRGVPNREDTHANASPDNKYGPQYITDLLGLSIAILDGIDSNKKTVYPYAWNEKHRSEEDFRATHPEAYAVHHWSSSWK